MKQVFCLCGWFFVFFSLLASFIKATCELALSPLPPFYSWLTWFAVLFLMFVPSGAFALKQIVSSKLWKELE